MLLLRWKHRVLTTGPLEKSLQSLVFHHLGPPPTIGALAHSLPLAFCLLMLGTLLPRADAYSCSLVHLV